jgi:fructose-1,6-bisphosphatase I
MVSEEAEHPVPLDPKGTVCVAIDPLDGSSNIETNVPVGTIFSIVAAGGRGETPTSPFLERGSAQKAAGYVIYGPQTALALTVGKGTNIFTLDPATNSFRLSHPSVRIPETTSEYAINGSNERHWSSNIRDYVADCRAGTSGPRDKDFNTRWIASLVAETHRILVRGGVFLYPSDARKGYEKGRLRLLYEANPIAFLVEQAGGKAFDGFTRTLDLAPSKIHERTALIFGSAQEMDVIARYKNGEQPSSQPSPLLRKRSLHTH